MRDKSRGPVKNHPLYFAWYEACRAQTICDKWKSDFWGFVDAIGEKPEGLVLSRLDHSKPLDIDNFIWKDNARRLNKPGLVEISAKGGKAGKEKHPLYHIHYHYRRTNQLCQEWKEDFWKFVEDVGEKLDGHSFQKLDENKPLSKDNFYWKKQVLINCADSREKRKMYARVWRTQNPTLAKNSDLKKHYGITLEDYVSMHNAQGGCCAICGGVETDKVNGTQEIRSLAVDHNHTTGQVRGLLCGACNKAIGYFKEDLQRLKKAVHYLESFEVSKDVPSNTENVPHETSYQEAQSTF